MSISGTLLVFLCMACVSFMMMTMRRFLPEEAANGIPTWRTDYEPLEGAVEQP